jgi:hypothetical protein
MYLVIKKVGNKHGGLENMAKLLRSLMTVGAGAFAYKALTKKDLLTDENVRNATIGAFSGMVGIPELERIVKGEISESSGKAAKTMALGGMLGAGIGYVLSSGKHKTAVAYAKDMYDKYLSPENPEEKKTDI